MSTVSTDRKALLPADAANEPAAGPPNGGRAKRPAPFDPLPSSTISPQAAKTMDRLFNSYLANFSDGIDPRVPPLAFLDWWVKLTWSPGTHARLVEKAARKALRINLFASRALLDPDTPPAIEALPHDHRFDSPLWQTWPYNVMSQSFLLTQQWWANATSGVPGLAEDHKNIVTFMMRQLLDLVSPANFPYTNPEVVDATLRHGGANLVNGWQHWLDDWVQRWSGEKPAGTEDFVPGKQVAATSGKVVYRNHLIELIQYAPSTSQVRPEPVLIVPAWIMKYYILDLSTHNSLVGYLVGQGYTVFMISWRNPTSEDRELSMEDYRRMGIMSALDAIGTIVPGQRVHAAGYCLGGTLLTIAAAAMSRNGDGRLKSLTLIASQTDFTEAGELMLFVNEAQVSFLESMMWDRGVLNSRQMSGAFQILRSNDLIWSRMVHNYLLGERRPPNDMMAWNLDQTRMPYRMHSEYLRKLFLNNDLAGGRYEVEGQPVAISDIAVPVFAIGTVKDHVAPWRSVYKINLLTTCPDVTFVLTSGGHNAGVVSEPGHPGRRYQIGSRRGGDRYIDADTWQKRTPYHRGSWWTPWQKWLAHRSSEPARPPGMGAPQAGLPGICDAPGTYVFQS